MPKVRLGYSEDEYRRKVEAGQWQAHQFEHGFLITEIMQYAEERVLTVHLLGGKNFKEWKAEADERLRSFAVANGCVAIEAVCRLGLEKSLIDLGYKRSRVLMRKPV